MKKPENYPVQPALDNSESFLLSKVQIKEEFFRSGGKGGQNVNKVESGVRLRALVTDPELLARLRQLFPGSVTEDDELIIECTAERAQLQNRKKARELLVRRLRQAAEKPKERVATHTPAASKERRLQEKERTARLKKLRRTIDGY